MVDSRSSSDSGSTSIAWRSIGFPPAPSCSNSEPLAALASSSAEASKSFNRSATWAVRNSCEATSSWARAKICAADASMDHEAAKSSTLAPTRVRVPGFPTGSGTSWGPKASVAKCPHAEPICRPTRTGAIAPSIWDIKTSSSFGTAPSRPSSGAVALLAASKVSRRGVHSSRTNLANCDRSSTSTVGAMPSPMAPSDTSWSRRATSDASSSSAILVTG